MGIEASALLGYAGMATSAVGAYNASKGAQAAYNAQAQVDANNAQLAQYQSEDALARGERNSYTALLKGRQLAGSQRAALAANGVDLGVGSALHLQDDTDFFAQRDANTVLDNAAREAWGYRVQGQNFTGDAALLRSRANAESPWMSAGTSLLGSAGKVASSWYKGRVGSTGGYVAPGYATSGLSLVDY